MLATSDFQSSQASIKISPSFSFSPPRNGEGRGEGSVFPGEVFGDRWTSGEGRGEGSVFPGEVFGDRWASGEGPGEGSGEQCRPLDFHLPPELEASEPPEARGLARDRVGLMVSYRAEDRVEHTRFDQLPERLEPGDVLVVNISATLPAALPATRADGLELELHLSTRLPGGGWSVELRRLEGGVTKPYGAGVPGEVYRLPDGGRLTLRVPYSRGEPVRLWAASLEVPGPLEAYLACWGSPIRYGYVRRRWPLEYYQTVYAEVPGSAEMPSAGRAFTRALLERLVARGVQVVPVVLHTGVASLEDHEPPYDEWYRVPAETARAVNRARQAGRRVVAVGTTVVRALETVVDATGVVQPGEGWTGLVVTPARGLRAVNALLTGFHEPKATHLAMLEALTGPAHLRHCYREALDAGYLWHEFGDLHLVLG